MVAVITALAFILAKQLPHAVPRPDDKKPPAPSERATAPASETRSTPASSFPESPLPSSLLQSIRQALEPEEESEEFALRAQEILEQSRDLDKVSAVVLTLYRTGVADGKRMRRVQLRVASNSAQEGMLKQAILAVRRHRNFDRLDTSSLGWEVQLDLVQPTSRVKDMSQLGSSKLGNDRFEPGVDGLLARKKDAGSYYILPGDAFVYSLLTMNHIRAHIARRLKGGVEEWSFRRFRTESQVSSKDKWIPLYRGMPVVRSASSNDLLNAALEGVRYVVETQKPNGQFLYYYDAATDTQVNHEHPHRDPEKDPYYNEVRHAGGAMLLMDAYSMTSDEQYLEPTRRAIDWFASILREYKLPDGKIAAYPYYNRKSKLGGAGIALYVISEYRRHTGDKKYDALAKKLANHIISQIQDTGEFYYYSVYLDKPVDTPELNRQLFSFYYPGEAICGLASYGKNMPLGEEEKQALYSKLNLAVDFLLKERPVQYASHFTALPSDSWLMMGANELWDTPATRRPDLLEFVYNEADEMVRRMYTPNDALYPDYPGSFYYDYGDQPYPDGARAEGLTAAMIIASKSGDSARSKKYESALRQVALATYKLCNTPDSVYAAPNPRKAAGGIRFKPTRQWIRIDSVQHVASFYLKFLRHIYGPGPLPSPAPPEK